MKLEVKDSEHFSHCRTLVNVIDNGFRFPDASVCNHLAPSMPLKAPYTQDILTSSLFSLNITAGDAENIEYFATMKITFEAVLTIMQQTFNLGDVIISEFDPSHFTDIKALYPLPIDTILYCRYKNESCDWRNFTIKVHEERKNCFSFKMNSEKDREIGNVKSLDQKLYLLILNPMYDNYTGWATSHVNIYLLNYLFICAALYGAVVSLP